MHKTLTTTLPIVLLTLIVISGCATQQRVLMPEPAQNNGISSQPSLSNTENTSATQHTDVSAADKLTSQTPTNDRRTFSKPTRAGVLQHPDLTETSGMISSVETPGVLFAVNDSGNAPTLFALRDDGQHIASWQTSARNRDWEDMAKTTLQGTNYLIIGDTGDNLKIHKTSTLYLFAEPSLDTPLADTLSPAFSITFTYEDGPRNVESFAVADNIVYLISKEPVTPAGAQASRLYTLPLIEVPALGEQVARFAGELPVEKPNLEARLAASLAGVDLNHPTALDFDAAGKNAYLLTYRGVVRFIKNNQQSWPEVFAQGGTRIHAHKLEQAEALAVDSGRAVFFTSENASAPIWALPLTAPL